MKLTSINPFLVKQLLAVACITSTAQAADQTWGANANTAWYTTTNWAGAAFPGLQGAAASNTDIATFTSAFTGTAPGINMGTASLNLGAISIDASRTTATNIGDSSATAGVLRLYGATVNGVANTILRNNGTGLFTLQAAQSGTMGVVLSNTTENIINTDGTGGITISSIISESVAGNKLTKTGTGTLTLSGANTYTGATTVNGGTLNIASTGALTSAISLASGATLTGTGSTSGDITFNNGSGILLDATGAVQGANVTANATTNVFVNTAPTGAVTRDVIRYTGTTPGTANFSAASNFRSGLYTDTGTKITLGYTAEAKTWNSAVGGTWGIGVSAPWSGATDTNFYQGDSVAFGNTAANQIVTLTGNLAPFSVAVSNAANTFTFFGSGAITGAASLTKSGAGTLNISTANTNTGTTTISGGTLTLSGGNNRLATTGTVNFSGTSTLDVGSTSQSLANLTVANGVTGTVNGSGGTLTVTAGNFQIGSATANTTQTANMSGLSNFIFNNSAGIFRVAGLANTGSGALGSAGVLTLGTTNTITTPTFAIGDFIPSTNSSLDTGTVNLGTTNTINADTVTLGANRSTGTLQYPSGTSNPTLTLRGSDGTSRLASIVVGPSSSPTAAGFGFTSNQAGTVNLVTNVTGTSTLDAMITTLTIGQNRRGGSAGGNPVINTGTFTMGAGTLDATTIFLGQTLTGFITAGTGSSTTGNLTVNGGTVKVNNFYFADQQASAASSTLIGNFNLNSGANLYAANIAKGTGTGTSGATRTFNWNDGTIHTYDSSTDLTFGIGITVNLASTGTHTFDIGTSRAATVASVLAGTNGTLTKAGDGTLTLNATNTYTGNTTVNGGTLSLATASLADASTVSIASGAILDLNHSATDTINALFINGVQQANGLYKSATGVGAGTVLASLTGTGKLQVTPFNTFSSWMGGYNFSAFPGADLTADGDADNDGNANIIENILGTAPNAATTGLTPVSATANSVTFKHLLNPNIATDVTYSYQWSTDLVEWKASGQSNTGGTTASISAGAPVSGEVTVTATISAGPASKLFVRVVATQTP